MGEIVESASLSQKVKLWIIEHFRILPTDERFKKLKEDQMELLFCYFVSSPNDEQYRKAHYSNLSKEEIMETLPEDKIKEMGYSEEELKDIKEALIIGGASG